MNNEIVSLHGRETFTKIKMLEKLQIKRAQKIVDMAFKKKWRDDDAIPSFAIIKHHLH